MPRLEAFYIKELGFSLLRDNSCLDFLIDMALEEWERFVVRQAVVLCQLLPVRTHLGLQQRFFLNPKVGKSNLESDRARGSFHGRNRGSFSQETGDINNG